MDKFRYSLDLGSGYVLIDVYENNLTLIANKDISPAFESKKLTGTVSLLGDTAESAFDNRDTLYYLPFKIEEYNGITWNDLHECYADIRGEYKRLSKVLSIKNFQEKDSLESELVAALNISYQLRTLVAGNIISQTITSTRLDVYSQPTSLTQANYKLFWNLEGNAIVTTVDPRWSNFTYYSTTGVSPNLIHRYSARSFTFVPSYVNGGYNYFKMMFDSDVYWVNATPPPGVYAEETLTSAVLLRQPHQLSAVLALLVQDITSSVLSFDSTDAGDLFDATGYYLGYTNECNETELKPIDFTLISFFKFILDFYDMGWYVDPADSKLKFERQPWIKYNTTLDWSVETVDLDNITFAYSKMPDRQKYEFTDKTQDSHTISYFDEHQKTDDLVDNFESPYCHDFWILKQQGAPAAKYMWIQWNGTTINVRDPKTLWDLYASQSIYASYIIWWVRSDPALGFEQIKPDITLPRPVYSLKIDKFLQDYSAFDLFSRITTDIGTGYLNNYKLDLNTGTATFDIWFTNVFP